MMIGKNLNTWKNLTRLLMALALVSIGMTCPKEKLAKDLEAFRSACEVPEGVTVDDSFVLARKAIQSEEFCQDMKFEDYWLALLDHAAYKNPDRENKKRFSNFLSWARDEGLIAEDKAKEFYGRYFTSTFVVLGDNYNNCSSTCQAPDTVKKQMEDELKDKEFGLLKVAKDKPALTQAQNHLQDLNILIDAVCVACQRAVN